MSPVDVQGVLVGLLACCARPNGWPMAEWPSDVRAAVLAIEHSSHIGGPSDFSRPRLGHLFLDLGVALMGAEPASPEVLAEVQRYAGHTTFGRHALGSMAIEVRRSGVERRFAVAASDLARPCPPGTRHRLLEALCDLGGELDQLEGVPVGEWDALRVAKQRVPGLALRPALRHLDDGRGRSECRSPSCS